jgi:glycosyltransferase involved in cell wall biosynthesis
VKITHILTRFDPDENPGGVERVVDELTQRQKENHQVKVLCRDQFNGDLEEERKGIQIKRAQCHDIKGLRTLTSIPSMRNLIQNTETDVFHIHDWSPFLNYLLAGSPSESILTLHNREENKIGRFLQNIAIRNADVVTGVSKDITERLEEADTIKNGVDTEKFTNKSCEGYYLFVGNLVNLKGVEELVEVWDKDMPELKIAGGGPLKEDLSEVAGNNINFEGEISHDEVAELIGNSSGLINPSRNEGFGLVWAEALSSGKPVLATKVGLGKELSQSHGVIMNPNYDLKELRSSINEFLNREYNPDSLREYAKENLDWDKVNEKYERVYQSL